MVNLFLKIKSKLIKKLIRLVQPQMIYGFTKYDGSILKNTRVGNSTYIGNKEKLDIKENVFIGQFNYIDASNKLTIGEGCQITNFVSILTHSSHISIRLYGKEYLNNSNLIGYVKGEVSIGNYSFIGPHSIIMPNTNIGKGCIVCAYSYVKGDFEDFSIIAGNPAKVIGDTRLIDETYLNNYPELQNYYYEWVNRK